MMTLRNLTAAEVRNEQERERKRNSNPNEARKRFIK